MPPPPPVQPFPPPGYAYPPPQGSYARPQGVRAEPVCATAAREGRIRHQRAAAGRCRTESTSSTGRHGMRRRSLPGRCCCLSSAACSCGRICIPRRPVFDLMAQYWPFLLIGWGLLRLIEVAVWRAKACAAGFSGGEVVLVVLICIAGRGIWAGARARHPFIDSGGLDFWGQQYDYPGVGDRRAAGMKRIVFENPRGNIKVTGGDTQRRDRRPATIDARLRRARTPTAPTATRRWRSCRKATTCWSAPTRITRPSNQRISDDLEVTVPRGVAVEVAGHSGRLRNRATSTGDVELACRPRRCAASQAWTATCGWTSAAAT